MPDSNPGPLPQKSGTLPMSHHIYNIKCCLCLSCLFLATCLVSYFSCLSAFSHCSSPPRQVVTFTPNAGFSLSLHYSLMVSVPILLSRISSAFLRLRNLFAQGCQSYPAYFSIRYCTVFRQLLYVFPGLLARVAELSWSDVKCETEILPLRPSKSQKRRRELDITHSTSHNTGHHTLDITHSTSHTRHHTLFTPG